MQYNFFSLQMITGIVLGVVSSVFWFICIIFACDFSIKDKRFEQQNLSNTENFQMNPQWSENQEINADDNTTNSNENQQGPFLSTFNTTLLSENDSPPSYSQVMNEANFTSPYKHVGFHCEATEFNPSAPPEYVEHNKNT